jgi:hypothetical protein
MWFCTMFRKKRGDYVVYIPLTAIKVAWGQYKEGRVFKAAETLNTGVAPRYVRISREAADALEAKYPHGVWVAEGLEKGKVQDLWIHIIVYGWEGAMKAPYEMVLKPSLPGEPMVISIDDQVLEQALSG